MYVYVYERVFFSFLCMRLSNNNNNVVVIIECVLICFFSSFNSPSTLIY